MGRLKVHVNKVHQKKLSVKSKCDFKVWNYFECLEEKRLHQLQCYKSNLGRS